MNPILSVCIPTYNRAEYLSETLDHAIIAIAGNWGKVELLISDNASNDNTSEVVTEYQKIYPMIRYHRNLQNMNDENFLIASNLAKGKYVWLLGDNRVLLKDSIDRIIDELDKGWNVAIVNYSLYSNNEGRIVKGKCYNENDNLVFRNHNKTMSYFGIDMGHISQVIFRKDLVEKTSLNEYDECVSSGWSFLYLIYRGIYNNANIIFLKKIFYIKKFTIINNDWSKPFVSGSSYILHKLRKDGYSYFAIKRARNRVVRYCIIPLIIYDKLNYREIKWSVFTIFKEYYTSVYFWVFCLPILILPRYAISELVNFRNFYNKARDIQTDIDMN